MNPAYSAPKFSMSMLAGISADCRAGSTCLVYRSSSGKPLPS
jgi:hypothetical protein